MILFLSSWHILIVIGVFLGFAALLIAVGILRDIRSIYVEGAAAVHAKHERRSAAAKKGHETRKRILDQQGVAPSQSEVDRVLRKLDAQAAAKQITPDDALGFIRGEDQ